MNSKDCVQQIIGCLLKQPELLGESDKYHLTIADFKGIFAKYIFSAIFNLYQLGTETISIIDIDNYLKTNQTAYDVFSEMNGIVYLQDCEELSNVDSFTYYYTKLKKINCLNDLKKDGFDISKLYIEDILDPKAAEVNAHFEELTVSDILNKIKESFMKIEDRYENGEEEVEVSAEHNIATFIEELESKPEVGAKLQGHIYNTAVRGARKGKMYIRSSASGVGKTRTAVGDACFLAYPIRFNTNTWRWEMNGSSEKTLFIATEQDLTEIQSLILAYLTGFNEETILYSTYTQEEKIIRDQALQVISYFKDNFTILRISNPNIEKVKTKVRKICLTKSVVNVFYDYIASSPALLNEFRDLRIREDVVLMMFATALKDLAVELEIFMSTSTQINGDDGVKGFKNQNSIRGAKAIIDKADVGSIMSEVTEEDEEILEEVIKKYGIKPNAVLDLYKNRRGRLKGVKIWMNSDTGTCRRNDLFITDKRYNEIDDFSVIDFVSTHINMDFVGLTLELNEQNKREKKEKKEPLPQSVVQEEIEQKVEKGIFGDVQF